MDLNSVDGRRIYVNAGWGWLGGVARGETCILRRTDPIAKIIFEERRIRTSKHQTAER